MEEEIRWNPETEPEEQAETKSIPLWVLLFAGAVCLTAVLVVTTLPAVFSDLKIYVNAEERIAEGETYDALLDFDGLTARQSQSVPVITKMVELCMENGYYDWASVTMDTYLTGKKLSNKEYAQMEAYAAKLEQYYNSVTAVDEIFAPYVSSLYQQVDRSLMQEELQACLEDPELDPGVIYYYLGILEEDIEQAIAYLEQCLALDTDYHCMDVRVQLGTMYRRMGDMDRAEELYLEAYCHEKEDSGALRGLGVLAMLRNDWTEAEKLLKRAYEIYPDGSFVREAYLLCLNALGDTDGAEAIRQEITEIYGDLEEDTKAVLSGAMTLEEYYIHQ